MSAETTRRAINGKARIQELAQFASMLVKYISTTRVVTDRAGRFMGLKMTIDKRALDAASDDLNTTLRPEFGAIDGMDTEAQQDAAARMKARIDSNFIYQEYKDGKLTYEVTAPRADLVRAIEERQVMRIMPLVACPEAPRQPAKPRSKSGQRRAHARWVR